ncbi:MAG: acetolactate synthase [Verrucomicrobiota bacterium]|jgi:hypothetical protein|uniref:ACT domain-containing protein n=1 Tax=Prosthecobacter algae TaxID=1144682 RepID=A0ABP9PGS7_9BACT
MQSNSLQETPAATAKSSPIRQLSVFLPNRVGSLMALVKLLQEHSIEVLGLSMQDTTEMTLVRLILSDPEGAAMLFIEKGIPHTDCFIIVVELSESDRRLTECLSVLLAAELNIEFCYPLLVRPGLFPLFALHCDDVDMGAEVLGGAGFKVLCQGDLSR